MMWGATEIRTGQPARAVLGLLLATGFIVASTVTMAQEQRPAKPEEPGVLESIGRWFDRQADGIRSSFEDAGKNVENFGQEAGIVAKTTAENAKEAADAMARLPNTRVVTGHQKCRAAPNGAPDCVSAATALCRTQGFDTGKSADMTTAEVCPAHVYLAGRNSGPGCRIETFVSRAVCQ